MNYHKGFAPVVIILAIALFGVGGFVYLKNTPAQTSVTATSTAQTATPDQGGASVSKTPSTSSSDSLPNLSNTHTNAKRFSCTFIQTKEFGTLYISNTSGVSYSIPYPSDAKVIEIEGDTPCGTPTGISSMVRFEDRVKIGPVQYIADGYRAPDYSYGFLSVLNYPEGLSIVYGVDHMDISDPNNWKRLGPLTEAKFSEAKMSVQLLLKFLRIE